MNPLIEDLGRGDEKLISLLKRLEGEDELFNFNARKAFYNVQQKRGNALDNLRLAYIPQDLRVNDWRIYGPNKVTLCVGDIFEFHQKSCRDYYFLDKNTEGIITDIGDVRVDVKFEVDPLRRISDVLGEVLPGDLIIYGRKRLILRDKTYPETVGDCLRLKKRDQVKLRRRLYFPQSVTIPAGIRGRLDEDGYIRLDGTKVMMKPYGDSSLSLIRPNNIDFDKLYRECYGE